MQFKGVKERLRCQRSAVLGMRMPSSWLHQSCDSLACFSFSFVLGSVSHFLPLPPPPRLVSFSLHWCFSVWRGPVPFLLCGGSWLGCAVVPVKGASFQSRSWLPILEAPGYSGHPTSTLAMQLLNGKKKRLQFLTQSYSILFKTVKPPVMATSSQQPPLQNSQFFWWTVHTLTLV